ncbi:MAG: hypothetical protein ACTS45_01380 [Candidatus Hodgkinia cicadicola]
MHFSPLVGFGTTEEVLFEVRWFLFIEWETDFGEREFVLWRAGFVRKLGRSKGDERERVRFGALASAGTLCGLTKTEVGFRSILVLF